MKPSLGLRALRVPLFVFAGHVLTLLLLQHACWHGWAGFPFRWGPLPSSSSAEWPHFCSGLQNQGWTAVNLWHVADFSWFWNNVKGPFRVNGLILLSGKEHRTTCNSTSPFPGVSLLEAAVHSWMTYIACVSSAYCHLPVCCVSHSQLTPDLQEPTVFISLISFGNITAILQISLKSLMSSSKYRFEPSKKHFKLSCHLPRYLPNCLLGCFTSQPFYEGIKEQN